VNLKRKGANYTSVLLRMMANYMQILAFAASFNLGWPESIKRAFDSVSMVSEASEMALSIDCFFDNSNIWSLTS